MKNIESRNIRKTTHSPIETNALKLRYSFQEDCVKSLLKNLNSRLRPILSLFTCLIMRLYIVKFFWQYLKQLFLNKSELIIINPAKYWHFYSVQYLEDCLNNDFLEHCYSYSYYEFVKQYRDFISRHYLEEGDRGYVDLCEYCWQLDYYRFCRCGNVQADLEDRRERGSTL